MEHSAHICQWFRHMLPARWFGVLIPTWAQRFFCSPQCPGGLWGPPSCLFSDFSEALSLG
jgi:hypothetical protein